MLTIPHWVLDPASPQTGEAGPITICAIEEAPTDCAIPGSLGRRMTNGEIVRRPEEDDIAAARLIAAAPKMRDALQALVQWARYPGGWDAPCWQEAERVLAEAGNAQAPAGEL